MSELRDLYQEVILDHYRQPRNSSPLEDSNHQASGHNPLCGDQIEIHLLVRDGIVEDIAFSGSGCAISTASASLMTESIKGKDLETAQRLFDDFHQMLTSEEGPSSDLGKLEVLSGVREFPMRVKCATLPWHTFVAALKGDTKVATTELEKN